MSLFVIKLNLKLDFPEYVCVCFPVCLRLSLAFMELIKTSLCSFGKTEK